MNDNWKKQGDAIIAINENGKATVLMMLTSEKWKLEAENEYNLINEFEFNMPVGMYYANFIPTDDDYIWEIVSSLYVITPDTTSFIVNTYDFTSEEYSVTTDDMEVMQLDAALLGVKLTDEAVPALIGHKFVVNNTAVNKAHRIIIPKKAEIVYSSIDLKQFETEDDVYE
jgi:hypothetical protein